MSKEKFSHLQYAMIHDLLPWSSGRRGKSHAMIVSELRAEGIDVSRKQVERALKSMEAVYGLLHDIDPKGRLRWKRSNRNSLGQFFYLEDIKGRPLDPLDNEEEGAAEFPLMLPGCGSAGVH